MDINRLIIKRLRIKGEVGALPWRGWNDTFSRTSLAEMFNELGYKVGAEIGVRAGKYSYTLCQKIPGVKMYCVDPWMPYVGRRPSQERMDGYYERTKTLLAPYDATLMRTTSMEAVKTFNNGTLDFVYIDAMHDFDNCMMDIICWSPKVRSGGIVAGHDYLKTDNNGVSEAVDSYTYAHHIHPWFVTSDIKNDITVSWFWVKR